MAIIIHNSAETLNAATAAATPRVQPSASQKKRWGGCWSLCSCFGSNQRVAVLVPEPTPATASPVTSTSPGTLNRAASFDAPPSSPVSFLQSDPPSGIHSPVRKLAFKSSSHSPSGAAATTTTSPLFTIGPYAYETQLVSPPAFSAGTTEPSTAAYTPTAPSSPEAPFAQLLSSSLAREGGNHHENGLGFPLSHHEFHPYYYPPLHDPRVSFELSNEVQGVFGQPRTPLEANNEHEDMSRKDFNFECEWWGKEMFPGNDEGSENAWTFFPVGVV